MGLNAVVYRNVRSLHLGCDRDRTRIEPVTGEVLFDDENLTRKYSSHDLAAVSVRFGNLSEIAALREEITGILDTGSLMVQRVVYSGTHSGDVVPFELIPRLSAEVETIAKSPQQSVELRAFVRNIETLVGVALREGNPIVFV